MGDATSLNSAEAAVDKIVRRRQRLSTDYQDFARTLSNAHGVDTHWATRTASRCIAAAKRQFLPHYFCSPPRWRIWLRQLSKERCLPDFCIVGPPKSGTSDLAITIMAHPNVLCPLVKEFSSTDPLTWGPFYPTLRAARRHAQQHGIALCAFVAPCLQLLDIPITLSGLRTDVKVVITLRNPVDLMFSQWKWNILQREKQFVDRIPSLASFPAYVSRALESFPELPGTIGASLHSGIYATAVAHWIHAFGVENVRILDVANYFKDRSTFLQGVEDFLGLPYAPLPLQLPVVNRNPLDGFAVDRDSCLKLKEFFDPYNRRLWNVIGTEYAW